MKKLLATIVLLLLTVTLGARVKLPALVGDHMVLQRDSEVNIWGWADAGKTVRIETGWNNETYTVQTAADGTWKALVRTTEAGGPYEIKISDGEEIVLKNILLGEVWVCGGQSNMEMPLKGFTGQPVKDANDAVVRAGNYPEIRLFTVKKILANAPADDVEGAWNVSSPLSALNFSAVGYYFGRSVHEALGVPVGLISCNWGGSYIEAWMDVETQKGFRVPDDKNLRATKMYNGMLCPLTNYGIAGWIWYQGESNRRFPMDYAELMSRMVGLWRAQWGRGDLPFYYTQIAPYVYGDGTDGYSTALIRDQQALAQRIPNVGMAVTMDIGDPVNIHPADKKTVGERLSYWALSETYGLKGIAFRAPEFQSMEVDTDGTVTVRFGYPEEAERGRLPFDNGLTPWDEEFDGFEVAGEDRIFHPVRARVDKSGRRNSVKFRCEQVRQPVAVRYCWKNYTVGTLFSTMGLPVSSFRSDDWPVQDSF